MLPLMYCVNLFSGALHRKPTDDNSESEDEDKQNGDENKENKDDGNQSDSSCAEEEEAPAGGSDRQETDVRMDEEEDFTAQNSDYGAGGDLLEHLKLEGATESEGSDWGPRERSERKTRSSPRLPLENGGEDILIDTILSDKEMTENDEAEDEFDKSLVSHASNSFDDVNSDFQESKGKKSGKKKNKLRSDKTNNASVLVPKSSSTPKIGKTPDEVRCTLSDIMKTSKQDAYTPRRQIADSNLITTVAQVSPRRPGTVPKTHSDVTEDDFLEKGESIRTGYNSVFVACEAWWYLLIVSPAKHSRHFVQRLSVCPIGTLSW